MLEKVDLARAYRLLNTGATVMISSAHKDKHNVMSAAWVMPLDFDPPKIIAVVDKSTYTRELIEASAVFAINIPCRRQADGVLAAGSITGRGCDKFAHCGFSTVPATNIPVPLVEGCIAYLECRLILEPDVQTRYDILIGEVVYASADADVFKEGRWCFEGQDDKRTLHYVAGGHFMAIGEACIVREE